MIWPLMKLDLRKILPAYLASLVVMIGFILITRDILDSANIFVIIMATIQGCLIAWFIFRDPGNTRSFLFSRPWSPTRIFWNRWALAVVLQILTVLLTYAILAAGTRTLIHQDSSPYFPMVERFELSILWPIVMAPPLTFHITMFLMLRSRVPAPGRTGSWRAFAAKAALALVVLVVANHIFTSIPHFVDAGQRIGHLPLLYAGAVAVLCTAASLNCYRNMEIES